MAKKQDEIEIKKTRKLIDKVNKIIKDQAEDLVFIISHGKKLTKTKSRNLVFDLIKKSMLIVNRKIYYYQLKNGEISVDKHKELKRKYLENIRRLGGITKENNRLKDEIEIIKHYKKSYEATTRKLNTVLAQKRELQGENKYKEWHKQLSIEIVDYKYKIHVFNNLSFLERIKYLFKNI